MRISKLRGRKTWTVTLNRDDIFWIMAALEAAASTVPARTLEEARSTWATLADAEPFYLRRAWLRGHGRLRSALRMRGRAGGPPRAKGGVF